ncbi:MAG: hypothetical protein SGARI_000880, partial [Bacillariaceae sp.]
MKSFIVTLIFLVVFGSDSVLSNDLKEYQRRFLESKTNLGKRWEGKVQRMTLQERMLTPTARDLRHGEKDGLTSFRLAKNRMLLGLAPVEGDERHRHLLINTLQEGIVQVFNESGTETPVGEGNRVSVSGPQDGTLPWGDGPGAVPGVPQTDSTYFKGEGFPQEMWEAVACPVADVDGFLGDPLLCLFGDGNGDVTDFIADIADNEGFISEFLDDVFIPLAAEAMYTFSGVDWILKIFGEICKIFDLSDDINKAVEEIKKVVDKIKKVVNKVKKIVSRRRKLQITDGGDFSTCPSAQHLSSISADTTCTHSNGLSDDDCQKCLLDVNATCDGCLTCWQGISEGVPDMDGICLPTADVRLSELGEDGLGEEIQLDLYFQWYSIITSNYVKKNAGADLTPILQALGTDGLNGEPTIKFLIDDLDSDLAGAEGRLDTKIESQCTSPAPAAAPTNRRGLKEDNKKDVESSVRELLRSNKATEARKLAQKSGMANEAFDSVFSGLFGNMFGQGGDKIRNEFKHKVNDFYEDDDLRKQTIDA